MADKQIMRLKLGGAQCRSAERLLVLRAEALEGVQAAAYDSNTCELVAFVDPARITRDDLVAVAVASGLAPVVGEPVVRPQFPRIAEPGGYYVP